MNILTPMKCTPLRLTIIRVNYNFSGICEFTFNSTHTLAYKNLRLSLVARSKDKDFPTTLVTTANPDFVHNTIGILPSLIQTRTKTKRKNSGNTWSPFTEEHRFSTKMPRSTQQILDVWIGNKWDHSKKSK